MDMRIWRQRFAQDEFDYQALIDSLEEYARPRDKISDLLKKQIIIRVKKGLYVFGEGYRRRPIAMELLANLIHGPSYLSLEYALHYYGLIPERVEVITSVALGRARSFATPLGVFSYQPIPVSAFHTGIDRVETEPDRAFLIATREKALCDKIVTDRGTGIQTRSEMRSYLLEYLRIDPNGLRDLNRERLSEISTYYRSRKLQLLCSAVEGLRKK
ncbi:MAG: hypothetical protein NTX50_07760 [Candidatus Sumerlaeota bacterium]|nr:hypothetical protein [Candidatus Sumerlaeota bacterium]